jgi:hypothetical protein
VNTFLGQSYWEDNQSKGGKLLQSVLGAADAGPPQTNGNYKDTRYRIHIFEICPPHSRRRAISIKLLSYQHRDYKIFRNLFLAQPMQQHLWSRKPNF